MSDLRPNDKKIAVGRAVAQCLEGIAGPEIEAKFEAVKAKAMTAFTTLDPTKFNPNEVLFAAGVYQGAITLQHGLRQFVENGIKAEKEREA
jgi:Cu2+-containing amine oxidase